MNKSVKVTIFSQIYNTPPAMLRRCIESVLCQTYRNFEFIIVDNGSTDGTKEILEEYQNRDSRIHLIRYEKNEIGYRAIKLAAEIATGEYIANIDSDDWFELNFLEELLAFIHHNCLDIAAASSCFVDEDGKLLGKRQLSKQLILQSAQFAEEYPYYHVFYRTIWAKLVRTSIFKQINYDEIGIKYGGDTCCSFLWLRAASRMGITNKVLHNYTIRKKSSSYIYDSTRFDSDVYLYKDAVDFLHSFGPISTVNQIFLYQVFANAVLDTLSVIQNSTLTTVEKMHEYAIIATHPIVQMAYRVQEESCKRSKQALLNLVCTEGLKLKNENEDLQRSLQALLPCCGVAATVTSLPLLLTKELRTQFLADNRDAVVKTLLELLPKIQDPQKYNLGVTMQRLAINHRLLFQVNDVEFLLQYSDIYGLIWEEKNAEALDQMTGLLLENMVKTGEETFLKLYIDLAALLNQENAFIFGKVRLAIFYFQHNRLEETHATVEELDELGLGELEDIQALRSALKQQEES